MTGWRASGKVESINGGRTRRIDHGGATTGGEAITGDDGGVCLPGKDAQCTRRGEGMEKIFAKLEMKIPWISDEAAEVTRRSQSRKDDR